MVFFSKHAIFSLLTGCLISLEPTAAEECAGDVVQVRQIGGTNYEDKPITILTQSADEITFELSQEWTTDSLDYLFVRFKDTNFGSPTCLKFENSTSYWKSEALTAVCSRNSKIALVEVWASDTEFSQLDTATLPDCACDAPADHPPMVKYTFTVECVSTCESTSCEPIAQAAVAAPVPVAVAIAVADAVEAPAEAGCHGSLHAMCKHDKYNVALFGGQSITFASGEVTRVVGDMGVSPGTSITGKHEQHPDSVTLFPGQAAKYAEYMWGVDGEGKASGAFYDITAWNEATDIKMGYTYELGGKVIIPGRYHVDTALNFVHGTTCTLDARDEPDAQFVFIVGTTFITAADTYFKLKGGAKAENIIWLLGTAATLGARSIVEGSIVAQTAITFGTMSEIRGCAVGLSEVTFESRGYLNVRKQSDSVNSCYNGDGVCEGFAVHARATITAASLLDTHITNGDMSVSPGTSITGPYDFVKGSITYGSEEFATNVLFNHADLRSRRSTETYWGVGAHEIGDQTFTPGVYRSATAINFKHGVTVTLDAEGDSDGKFLFQAGSTFVTAADTYFILKGGAQAKNVIWALGTAATLGARSVVPGNILAGTAITFGIDAKLLGCAIAFTAVDFETEGYVTLPDSDGNPGILP